jgi:hypothetical protein
MPITSTRGRGATRTARVAQPDASVAPASNTTAMIFFMICSFLLTAEEKTRDQAIALTH